MISGLNRDFGKNQPFIYTHPIVDNFPKTNVHTHTHSQELLKCCVSECVEKLPSTSPQEGGKKKMATKVEKMNPAVGSVQAAFRYQFLWHSAASVLKILLFHCCTGQWSLV
jgi:hypothetical protein